jgi:hypothetical protein
MAKHMVLTYLHQLDPAIPIERGWMILPKSHHRLLQGGTVMPCIIFGMVRTSQQPGPNQ